jgi:hypothetical protein
MKLRTSITFFILGSATLAFASCGDDSETGDGSGGDQVEITLEAKDELFPGFEYDTGLLPEVSPIKASFTVSAKGETAVAATCAVSGSKSKPVLTGLPEGGKITIDGGFAMLGRLSVDDSIPGIDPYEGEIPGIEDVVIEIVGDGKFDPFVIDEEASATAEIPEADLPPIPLGSVPGELQIHIGDGSFVEIGWSGTCAGIDGEEATYAGTFIRSGKLVLEPKIVIDALVDTIEVEIGSFEIDLALGSTDASATAEVKKFGGAPSKGDEVDSACGDGDGDGEGGGDGDGDGGGDGEGGGPTTSSSSSGVTSSVSGFGVTTGGGPMCETEAQCDGVPCVEGTCGNGMGLCGSGLTYADEAFTECASDSCCDSLAACTFDYSDVDGCNECLGAGGGPRCDTYLGCLSDNCFGGICESGLATGDVDIDTCLGDACCDEFIECTQGGVDTDSCVACFDAGGGPLCDAAIACETSSGCYE